MCIYIPPSSVRSSSRVLPAVIRCICRSQVCLRFRVLWRTIRRTRIPESHLNLIKDLHQGSNSQVRVGSRLSPSFPTGSGIRLGCVLAPALFCRVVDWILEETFSHSGLLVPYHHMKDIDYTNDIATIDSSQAVLADTLQRMEGACSAVGLRIS